MKRMIKMAHQPWKIWRDFRIWIIAFFLLRLIGITHPPIETSHSWRQSFTCMVARNFLEESANPLFPRIDHYGTGSDIVASEFPLFNYLIYLVSLVFGYEHWYGRLINLVISSLGIWVFFRFLRQHVGPQLAFSAGLLLLSSVWFAFSRKIMPDTFSAALMLIALGAGGQYLRAGKLAYLAGFFLTAALGGLSKIPTIVLLGLLFIPLPRGGPGNPRIRLLAVVAGLSVLPVIAWYFWWQPHLLQTYGNQLYFPFSISEGIAQILALWPQTIEKFYFTALQSFLALPALLAGLFLLFKDCRQSILIALLLGFIPFLLFMIKTGDIFPTHDYYIIPFTPYLTLTAGYALIRLPRRWAVICTLAIMAEGVANQQHDLRYPEKHAYKLELEMLVDRFADKEDKIATSGGFNPQLIYLAHREGWSIPSGRVADLVFLQDLQSAGCRLLVLHKKEEEQRPALKPVFENEHFLFYTLPRN